MSFLDYCGQIIIYKGEIWMCVGFEWTMHISEYRYRFMGLSPCYNDVGGYKKAAALRYLRYLIPTVLACM